MKLKEVIDAIPDVAAISSSIKVTVGAGLTGILAGAASWNWPAMIASTVAISGLAVNFYFQRRRDKREQEKVKIERELADAKLAALREHCDLPGSDE